MTNTATFLTSLLIISIVGCKKEDDSNPVTPVDPINSGKTTVLLEKGLFDCASSDGMMVVIMGTARATVSNPDSSVYFALSETSPPDTFVVLSHGTVNSVIASRGIPVADEYWGVRAHMQKGDSARTTTALYADFGGYSLIDSMTFEPYRLIGARDTIFTSSRYLMYWKPNYRIDTLRFHVYVKSCSEFNYDRFTPSSTSFSYKIAAYDSTKRVVTFTVGLPTMSAAPNIVYQPFATVEHQFENSYLKVISRFYYQQLFKLVPFLVQ